MHFTLEAQTNLKIGFQRQKKGHSAYVQVEATPTKVRCYDPRSTVLAEILARDRPQDFNPARIDVSSRPQVPIYQALRERPRVVEQDLGARIPIRPGEAECVDLTSALNQAWAAWQRNRDHGRRRAVEASTWSLTTQAESSADAEARFAQRPRLEPTTFPEHFDLNFPADAQPPRAVDWSLDINPGHQRINVDWLQIHQRDPEDSAGMLNRQTVRPDVPQARAERVSALTVAQADIDAEFTGCARAPVMNDVQLIVHDFFNVLSPANGEGV